MNDGLWLWPWETCGEIFYGWAPPEALTLDWSVPRQCNLPVAHRGCCDYCLIHPAGHFPQRENRLQRRERLYLEKRKAAMAS
jgi:hypothetical protein